MILAIDPGNADTGFVLYDSTRLQLLARGKWPNGKLLTAIRNREFADADSLAIEHAQSFGMKVWNQVFDATLWGGRFVESWDLASGGKPHRLVYRRDAKVHVTGSGKAKDQQVRQCLLERWGGKDIAMGTRKTPGPLAGVTADMWAALAIAVYAAEVAVFRTDADLKAAPLNGGAA